MASIANITVFDGASTPVSHTLTAISSGIRKDGVWEALWRENLASVPVYAQISARLTMQKLTSGITKVVVRVEVPVMESVSGQNAAGYTAAPKVAYVDTHEYTSFSHERSTQAGRRLARQILLNLAGNISTSVSPASAGPVPEAVDGLVMPT